MIVLHQFEISPFCDKIRRVLHLKGQPYEVLEVSLLRSPRHLHRENPSGKLPCLEHDGRFVCDSTEIARYLEECFPDPPLLPADPRERALCCVLEDWADESLYFYEMRLRFTIPANAKRFVPALLAHDPRWFARLIAPFIPRLMGRTTRSQGLGRKSVGSVLLDVERNVQAVGGLLGGRSWLVGDAISLADLSVHAQLACIRQTPEGAEIVGRLPAVEAWLTRVEAASGGPPAGPP